MAGIVTAKKHALFAPSSAKADMACPGRLAMCFDLPDSSSSFADEGTCAHFLGAHCLRENVDPVYFLGRTIALWFDPKSVRTITEDAVFEGRVVAQRNKEVRDEGEGFKEDLPEGWEIYYSVVVDADFGGAVRTYTRTVGDYALGAEVLVEQRLSIHETTREDGAAGTTDAAIILPSEIAVGDLKFGQGVEVSAVENPQLMIYALSAYDEFSPIADFDQVRLFISQPRITSAPSEWVCSVTDLLAFREEVRKAAKDSFIALEFRSNWMGKPDQAQYLVPGVEQCKFCKAAKANLCPQLDRHVEKLVESDFDDLTVETVEAHSRAVHDPAQLGAKLRATPLIETWIAGVRAAAERELIEHNNAPDFIAQMGFKLVQGKKGNRQWKDEAKAEMLLRRLMGAANCYKPKVLITPTEATKAFEKDSKNLKSVEKLVVQHDGKPSVQPISDSREPLVVQSLVNDFENLDAEDDLI